jgi:hypothetical protein
VKTQICIAVSVYVVVAIIRKRLGLEASLYQILQILSVTLFEKTPILQALQASRLQIKFTRLRQPLDSIRLYSRPAVMWFMRFPESANMSGAYSCLTPSRLPERAN